MKKFAFAAAALFTLAATTGLAVQAATIGTVSDANFAGSVLHSNRPVLVDFYADWCGPCRQLAPLVDDLAQHHPDVKFVRVNIDNSPQTASQYGITSIPTIAVFKHGQVVGSSTGYVSEQQLEATLDNALARRTASR